MASDNLPTIGTQDRPHAPVVYFEVCPISSHLNGLGRITLSAALQTLANDGQTITTDLVVTGYLRSNIQGFVELRDAINRVILLAQPAETAAKN